MPFRRQVYTNKYSSFDWDVMANAYKLAFYRIGSNPLVQRDRLARSIMTFFDTGVRCGTTLSSLAVGREMSLVDIERARGALADDKVHASDEVIYHDGATETWKNSTTN
jgi:hypothetical protein